MAAPKGHPRYGGRRKGAPNKFTASLKQMILGALEQAGGQAYLLARAKEDPAVFCALLARVLPLSLAADIDSGARVTITVSVPNPIAERRDYRDNVVPLIEQQRSAS